MGPGFLIIVFVFLVALFVVIALLLDLPVLGTQSGRSSVRSHMRNIVSSQRTIRAAGGRRMANIFDTAAKSKVERVASAELTLPKRLKYAQWTLPPLLFRMSEFSISVISCYLVSFKFNTLLTLMSLMIGPILMNWLLNTGLERRFKKFDSDYPQFILSLIGLLKTGMNTMQGIEAAAAGLEDGSLVRHEVELMMERLRFGVSEEKSIGSFGEDIFHPEIELFVQALLLSRRVGGNLSDTLERLAKQVRKRQYFRSSANAAVGMQRGSIWFIVVILIFMEGYMLAVYPDAIYAALADEIGWQVYQFGFVVILLGIFWVRQVTKIKV